jgi:hypothetical protein
MKLTQEEKSLLDSVEQGEWKQQERAVNNDGSSNKRSCNKGGGYENRAEGGVA